MTQANGNQNVPVPMDPTYPVGAYSLDRRLIAPRRVRNGIKLRTKANPPLFRPIVQEWLSESLAGVPDSIANEGLEYARSGQTIHLDLEAGKVIARVQGRAPSAYEVTLTLPTWPEDVWNQLLESIAADAGATASLLADDLPHNLSDALRSRSERLLPPISNIETHCACGNDQPCKHVIAVTYLMADRIDEHPPVAFALRGLPPEQAVDRLRNLRTRMHAPTQSRGRSSGLVLQNPSATPLEHSIEDFWRTSAFSDVRDAQPIRHPPYALLHRLGPSPLGGKFPLVGLLASVYDTVAKHAGRLREQKSREVVIDMNPDDSAPTNPSDADSAGI